jgi:uncharacterized protein (DUF169 family)
MKGIEMRNNATLAQRLTDLLGLTRPPVAVSFDVPATEGADPFAAQPAGCCFWSPAQERRLDTVAADHANCSVGSYTHGLIPLEQAASGADTAALLGSGWVAEQDLMNAAALPFRPASITYQPLAEAETPSVVLAQLSPASLMTLLGAAPDLALARKPQCVIVPLAAAGQVAVSPGCAVSRARTGLPAEELTCAIPASELESIIERLDASTASDRAVSQFAAADMALNFATA